jgi:predicted ATPase
LAATKGLAAPETGHTYTRARELYQQVGDTPQLFPVLWGLGTFYHVRAEHQTARELGQQFLTLAQRQQDPAPLVLAHRMLGTTLFFLGELLLSHVHLEQCLALYDPQQHRSLALHYGTDPGVGCLSVAAWLLWTLGYPDQALQSSHEALTLAHELAHPYSLGLALGYSMALHQYRRDERATQERAEAVITLSTEQGFSQWLAMGTLFRGRALLGQGEGDVAQMHQGTAAWRATGAARVAVPSRPVGRSVWDTWPNRRGAHGVD